MENDDYQFPPKFLVNLKDTYKVLWMGFYCLKATGPLRGEGIY